VQDCLNLKALAQAFDLFRLGFEYQRLSAPQLLHAIQTRKLSRGWWRRRLFRSLPSLLPTSARKEHLYMVSFDRLGLIILIDTYQFVGARSFIPLCLIIEDLTNKLQLSGAHLWSRERHFLAIEALDHARKKQSNDGAYNTGLERLHNIN
jgi:hypothetical protein